MKRWECLSRIPTKVLINLLLIFVLLLLRIFLGIKGYFILFLFLILAILLIRSLHDTADQNIPETWKSDFQRSLKSFWSFLLLIIILTTCLSPFYIQPIMKTKAEENRAVLHEIVKNITANATTDIEKAKAIYHWFDTNSGNIKNTWHKKILFQIYPLTINLEPPYFCIRLINHDYPLWVLTSRCGACEEYALLYMEMANEAGLKVRSIHNHGEEHNWDEVFINDRWIIVDPSARLFDPSPSIYERGRRLNVSYIFALYPNGSIEDVTNRYTRTSTIKIRVTTDEGNVLPNATITVYSKNYNSAGQFTGLTCKTGRNGICVFHLGGGKYEIKVMDSSVIPRLAKIELKAKEGSTITLSLHAKKSILSLLYIKLPSTLTFASRLLLVILLSLMLWYLTVAYITLFHVRRRQAKM